MVAGVHFSDRPDLPSVHFRVSPDGAFVSTSPLPLPVAPGAAHTVRIRFDAGAPEDVRRFLRATGRHVPECWPWALSYLGTEADIARKLQDLDLRSPTKIDPAIHRRNAERILLPLTFFPVRLPVARHVPVLPEVRILAALANKYSPAGNFRNYIIAVKR